METREKWLRKSRNECCLFFRWKREYDIPFLVDRGKSCNEKFLFQFEVGFVIPILVIYVVQRKTESENLSCLIHSQIYRFTSWSVYKTHINYFSINRTRSYAIDRFIPSYVWTGWIGTKELKKCKSKKEIKDSERVRWKGLKMLSLFFWNWF